MLIPMTSEKSEMIASHRCGARAPGGMSVFMMYPLVNVCVSGVFSPDCFLKSAVRAHEHAEQITRVVRVGDHIEGLVQPGIAQAVAGIARSRKVLGRESHTVKQCYLPIINPAGRGALTTCHIAVTGKSSGICRISHSIRV